MGKINQAIFFVAKFPPLSEDGCWHTFADSKGNLSINWLEKSRTKEFHMANDKLEGIDKTLEVIDRLGSHIADAIDIARKAKDAMPELGDLDSDEKKRLLDAAYGMLKKIVLALN